MSFKKVALIILILTVALTGCKFKSLENPDDPKVIEAKRRGKVNEFMRRANGSNLEGALEYLDENIADLDSERADLFIYVMEDVLLDNLDDFKSNIIELDKDNELESIISQGEYLNDDEIMNIQNEELRDLLENELDNPYKLKLSEDGLNLEVNYELLMSYKDYMTPEMGQFMAIKRLEHIHPSIIDGIVAVDYSTISEKLLAIESYMAMENVHEGYESDIRYETALRLYRDDLIAFYVGGVEDSIYKNGLIKDEVLAAYRLAVNDTKSNLGLVTARYMDYLKGNSYYQVENSNHRAMSAVMDGVRGLEERYGIYEN